ncbi:Bug family tripartite tricarboxylate transporter substrate binding protein [Falsiroseomonas sp. HW251]|uniref:Bug family tripartite tricarboxylate transporter substrate binding protein n=1 Tax=Falsiroseomonas sp. HW251 TaxID=3390998 RepID=UPI003D31FC44
MDLARRGLGWAAAALMLGAAPNRSIAQPVYPTRPVRILVGAAPGGTADVVARLIAQELTATMGQPFVVENRAGASSTLAAGAVATAAPDGYTLLLGASNTHAIGPNLMRTAYNHIADFAPVSLFCTGPLMLVVNPVALDVQSVPELIEKLKADPGRYNFGSTSNGTGQHIAGELLKLRTGARAEHVPYATGSAQLLAGLLGNQVQFAFDSVQTMLPQVADGRLRGLAVSSRERVAVAPDLPPMADFVGDFDIYNWWGILAPRQTPRPIVERLSAEIQRMVRTPEMRQRILDFGCIPVGSTPDAFEAHVRTETEKYGRIIRDADIRQG